MGVHLFGAVSSTSCTNFALRKAADDNLQQFDSEAINTVKRNFYVDSRLKSVPGEEEAICLTNDLRKLLEKGGFSLTKWVSNSHRVIESLHVSEKAGTFKDLHSGQLPIERALGLLFQEFWARGLDWDQPLDSDIENSWETWKKELATIDQIRVPRCLLRNLCSVDKVELHGFGDASKRGYGSVVYICAKDKVGNRIAKSWAAPVKRVSLPRLEVLAAYITAKLLDYVIQALPIVVDTVYGSQNPADLVTRGIPSSKVRDCKQWWKGPHWLQQPRCHWPVGEMPKTVPEQCLVEARNDSVGVNDIVCLATVQESIPALALRYETWQCLVRVTAWILKWSRLRGEPKKGKLSEEELKESEFTWLRNRQGVVFLPEIEELCNKGQLN
ncbi:PREDICTED: uncharacterized protein LOC107348648 [Acropora digitifera]|uniref:uncharacterized protein LOC107348648 n=1 Tax=Acropora digitifera TaxID=70779 RepID=UPI00077A917B|nr:PREDICTED: uncharacterized protein LOC107348648 [Acropora digitifera]